MRTVARLSLSLALLFGCGVFAIADTIRLKDGTVVRGQIVGFKDQQFTVLIGSGERGRRSRMMIYMEDVEAIEFDSSEGVAAADATSNVPNAPSSAPASSFPQTVANNAPPAREQQQQAPPTQNTTNRTAPSAAGAPFFQVNVRVRADSTTNGWTNSGLVVRKGQRLRISSSGRVSLGQGRFTTPAGIATLSDKGKLMQNEPTGALIAVVGDDNDEFILVGGRREFVAQRDGVLFLGVNEGELGDNTGNFDVTIEAETAARAAR